jgi:hypothetical protein
MLSAKKNILISSREINNDNDKDHFEKVSEIRDIIKEKVIKLLEETEN